MPGLFDLIQGAMGRPDPAMQIHATLGQLPGQPGSPAGPQPLAALGGPPTGATGQAGPPGASGGPAPPPQGPTAYQTPPDLGSMFVQLMQRQQSNEQFNRGIGMIAAGFAQPRDRATMIDAMSNQSGDPASLMGNVMKLTQYNQQQQRLADMQKNLPAIADAMGLPIAAVQTMYASNPEGFGAEVAKIQEAQMGLTGDPTQRELSQARREWMKSNPNKTEADMLAAKPELAGPVEFATGRASAITEANQRTKDVAADRSNLPHATDAYDNIIKDSEALLAKPGLDDIVGGWANQHKTKDTPGMAATTQDALALYDKVMGNQYAAGVQDFKGAGRITQQELKQDLPGQSTMTNRAQSAADFRQGVQDYIKKMKLKRAQAFGAAGQLDSPNLSDEDYANVDPIYKPGGDLFVKGQGSRPEKAASPAEAGSVSLKPLSSDDLASAKTNIAKYGRDAVIAHLKANNYDTSGL